MFGRGNKSKARIGLLAHVSCHRKHAQHSIVAAGNEDGEEQANNPRRPARLQVSVSLPRLGTLSQIEMRVQRAGASIGGERAESEGEKRGGRRGSTHPPTGASRPPCQSVIGLCFSPPITPGWAFFLYFFLTCGIAKILRCIHIYVWVGPGELRSSSGWLALCWLWLLDEFRHAHTHTHTR